MNFLKKCVVVETGPTKEKKFFSFRRVCIFPLGTGSVHCGKCSGEFVFFWLVNFCGLFFFLHRIYARTAKLCYWFNLTLLIETYNKMLLYILNHITVNLFAFFYSMWRCLLNHKTFRSIKDLETLVCGNIWVFLLRHRSEIDTYHPGLLRPREQITCGLSTAIQGKIHIHHYPVIILILPVMTYYIKSNIINKHATIKEEGVLVLIYHYVINL